MKLPPDMILIDPRDGSRELLPHFSGCGVRAELSQEQLPAGDVCFEGNGPEGRCLIGVERKTLRDMMNSVRYGRFAGHQLVELQDMYRMFQFYYLIVEGIYRPGADGLLETSIQHQWVPLEINGQRFMYQELAGALMTFECFTNLKWHRTMTITETVRHILCMYRWWNNKEWDEHRAHVVRVATHVEIMRPWSLKRRIAGDLPGIGQERSLQVARAFPNARWMINAGEGDWMAINGIGKVMARKIIDGLNEVSDE